MKEKPVNGVGSQHSHTNSEHGVSSVTNADAHASAASSRLDSPADLNGLVRLGERRNLISARLPSGSARALQKATTLSVCELDKGKGKFHPRTVHEGPERE